MRRTILTVAVALALLIGLFPITAGASVATHSDNIEHVKNLQYQLKYGQESSEGTDIEFAEIGGREYALAGSYLNGLQIVDITEPENAFIASVYDCGILQGDVQAFQQGDRHYVTYTSENTSSIKVESRCVQELTDATASNKAAAYGTYIIDVTDPLNPQSAGFISVPEGSHNGSVHPSGNYFYNSNSSLYHHTAQFGGPGIEVYDISDVTNPQRVTKLDLPVVPLSLGTESHDITFNSDGSRAYSAALSQGVIIDTTKPAEPTIISNFVDPTIQVWHQSDPVSLTAPDGTQRDFVIVEDEYYGAAGGPHCPSGGVHVFDVTGENELDPVKVGYWNIDDMRVTDSPLGRCTAHVFDIHEDEGIMTMAFYNGGVRVIDLNGLAGVGLGDSTTLTGDPMLELAHYYFDDSDTWAVKTPKIHPVTGDMYLYANDIARGLDIFKYEGDGAPGAPGKGNARGGNGGRSANADGGGTWMTPAEAALFLGTDSAPAGYKPLCLLPQ